MAPNTPKHELLAQQAGGVSSRVNFCVADQARSTPESISEQSNKICGNSISGRFKESNNGSFR